MQLIKPVLSGLASSFEVTHEATDAWNTRIQKKLANSVWTVCHSWYCVGHTGKNTAIWPGPLLEQWWQLRSPIWGDYKAVGAAKWESKRRAAVALEMVEMAGLVAVLAWAYSHPEALVHLAVNTRQQVIVQLQSVLPMITSYIKW